MKYIEKKHKIIIVTSFIVVIFALFTIWSIDNLNRSSKIIIQYTPLSSIVEVNNKVIKKQENKVYPGEYKISIKKDGFDDFYKTIQIQKGETITVLAILNPNREDTMNWYKEHPEDQQMLERISFLKMDEQDKIIEKNFPIGKILPYVGPKSAFRIDYGKASRPDTQAVYISYYTEVGKNKAIEYIESKGFSIDDYEVIYKELEFGEEPERGYSP